ncbi:MAG TPA: MFS transporter [Alphaproteobacteria bacterium]|nr:MFS transporter [Alphaproteobacteria bacterium]
MIAILAINFGFVFIDRNAFGYLAPFIGPDLGLNNTEIGAIVSALSFTWALSGILLGGLAEAVGKRKAFLIVSVVVFSLCSVLSGIAGSFLMLMAARLIMGFSEGGIAPISQSLVVLESSHERRGANMGIMQNSLSSLFGSFAAPLVLVAIANWLSWRDAFYLAAIPGMVMAFVIARYIREPTAREVEEAHRESEAPPPERMSRLAMFKFRNMWLCVLISCVMVCWMVLGWTFLPVFFTSRGVPASTMSYLVSVLGLAAAVWCFIVPGLSDKIGRKPVMIFFLAIGVITPLGALYYHGSPWIIALLLFIGWAASGVFPMFMGTIPSETVPVAYFAPAFGLTQGIGEMIGSVIGATAAGRAADVYGQAAPLWIMVGCAVVAAVFALFLKETAPIKVGAVAVTEPA